MESVILRFNVYWSLAKVTFFEIARDKILYNIIACAVLLFGFGILAARLSYVRPDRIVLNFGLTTLAISCSFIAMLVGATFFIREIQNRTIHVALSKPINRMQFLIGKYLGLVGLLFVNWGLLSVGYVGIYIMMGGELSTTLVWGMVLLYIQSILLAAIALAFSTFTTSSLSVVFTTGIYIIGVNASNLRAIADKIEEFELKNFIFGLSMMFPNFEYFNLGTRITYHLPIPLEFGITSILYGMLWIIISLGVAGFLVYRKEI